MGALRELRREGMGFTLDVLGEASVSEREAVAYQQTYLDLIDGLADEAASWPAVPVVDDSAWGPLPRVNLSLKITSLYSQIDPVDFDGSVAAVKDRLRPDLPQGDRHGRGPHARPRAVQVPRPHLSPSSRRCWTRRSSAATTTPASSCRPTCATPTRTSTGCIAWAKERGRRFHLRLVKGAYWDYETVIAAQEAWPVPVFTHKPDTDAMYEKLAETMLRHPEQIQPGVREPQRALPGRRHRHGPRPRPPRERLRDPGAARHGRADQARDPRAGPAAARVRAGRRADPRDGLPRAAPAREHGERLLPAPDVRRGRGRGGAHPGAGHVAGLRRASRRVCRWSRPTDPADPAPFVNQPHADFSRQGEPRRLRRRACARCAARLGAHYPLCIGGRDDRHGEDAHVGEPGEAGRGGRHDRLRWSRRGRGRGRRGARRAPGLARHAGARARRAALPRRRADAPREPRALGAHDARGRQDAARGERRRRRGDRLPRVLRPRGAAPRQGAPTGPRPRRAERRTSTSPAAWPW